MIRSLSSPVSSFFGRTLSEHQRLQTRDSRLKTRDRRLIQNGPHMAERIPAIKLVLLPKDTNAYGTIFGGVILSHIDLASAVEARKTAPLRYVTRAMREVEIHEPV